MIQKVFKYRLKTNSREAGLLARYTGCCRFVWNKALSLQKERLDNKDPLLSKNAIINLLPGWKKEVLFLQEPPSQALQQGLINLDRALKDAFDKKNPKKFPVFKKRGKNDSFRIPQGFEINGQAVKIPKTGWVRYFNSRKIKGTPKNLTISRVAGKWYVSVQVEIDAKPSAHDSKSSAGVDRGVAISIALSDGTCYEPVNSYRKMEKKLAKLQRILFRKEKFSRNWNKQVRKIQALQTRIANTRRDFLHKTSTEICKNHAVIIMEDLRVKNMTVSAKGTVEKPGRNVKQKSGLNKSILDQGWSEFQRQVEYKTAWRGGYLLLVPPAYTSQKCSACGHVSPDNRKTQAVFSCIHCGHTENADINAAKNIKAAGLAVTASGEFGAVRPLDETGTCLEAVAA